MSTSVNTNQNEKLQTILQYIQNKLNTNTLITISDLNEYFDYLSNKKLPPQTTTTQAPQTTTPAPLITTTPSAPTTTTEEPVVTTTTQEVVTTQTPSVETQPTQITEPTKVVEKQTIPEAFLRNFGMNCAPVFNTTIH